VTQHIKFRCLCLEGTKKRPMWVRKGASRVMIPNIFEKKKTEVNIGFLVARSQSIKSIK